MKQADFLFHFVDLLFVDFTVSTICRENYENGDANFDYSDYIKLHDDIEKNYISRSESEYITILNQLRRGTAKRFYTYSQNKLIQTGNKKQVAIQKQLDQLAILEGSDKISSEILKTVRRLEEEI